MEPNSKWSPVETSSYLFLTWNHIKIQRKAGNIYGSSHLKWKLSKVVPFEEQWRIDCSILFHFSNCTVGLRLKSSTKCSEHHRVAMLLMIYDSENLGDSLWWVKHSHLWWTITHQRNQEDLDLYYWFHRRSCNKDMTKAKNVFSGVLKDRICVFNFQLQKRHFSDFSIIYQSIQTYFPGKKTLRGCYPPLSHEVTVSDKPSIMYPQKMLTIFFFEG